MTNTTLDFVWFNVMCIIVTLVEVKVLRNFVVNKKSNNNHEIFLFNWIGKKIL